MSRVIDHYYQIAASRSIVWARKNGTIVIAKTAQQCHYLLLNGGRRPSFAGNVGSQAFILSNINILKEAIDVVSHFWDSA